MKNPPLQPRSTGFSVFMAMPILFGFFLLVALGLLAAMSWFGGEARGDRVRMELAGECAGSSSDLVLARAKAIGLGNPVLLPGQGRLVVEATLPGLEDDHVAMPRLLGSRGFLELRAADSVLASSPDLEKATLSLDESGMPYVALQFSGASHSSLQKQVEGDPKGSIGIYIDGVLAVDRPNAAKIVTEEIRLVTEDGPTRERMRQATDRMILLSHGPLSCTLGLARLEIIPEEET